MAIATHVQLALAGRRGPLWIGLLAVLISLPALRLGLMADDHILALQVDRGDGPWGLFSASPERLAEWRARGGVAWWASPRLAIRFFRPLASLSHQLDFQYWPEAAWLMTLWNALLYGLCALLAALLYRRLFSSARVAGVAALLFTVNEAHAMSVGWISGRNTVLALLGSLSALYWHVRARQQQRAGLLVPSALSVALALLSAEAGSWALGMLLAYALVLEPGSLRARLLSIAPQLAVAAVWACVYLAMGNGVQGTSFYRELSTPLSALREGLFDLPLALTSLFGPSLIGLALFVPTLWARLVALPVALVCLWLVWPAPALRAQAGFRFTVAATLACLPPSFLAIAQDRTLIGASLGAFGWIALTLDAAVGVPGLVPRVRRAALLLLHLVLALPLYFVNLGAVSRFERGSQALVALAEPGRDMVLVNTPFELLSNYTLSIQERSSPRHDASSTLHQLFGGSSELLLERVDPFSLDIMAISGWGRVPIHRIFCARSELPAAGTEIHAQGLTVRVLDSTPDGLPQRVRFTFALPLESQRLQWLVWRGSGPVSFAPPALGQRVRLAPLAVMQALPP